MADERTGPRDDEVRDNDGDDDCLTPRPESQMLKLGTTASSVIWP
jgi:hypothetical protein